MLATEGTESGLAEVPVPTPPTYADPIAEIAAKLAAAEHARTALAPVSTWLPGLGLEAAYGIQRINIERRVTGGAGLVGHKVGLTSVAMQEQMGVSEPDSGVLLDDMAVPEGGTLCVGDLLVPRIEAEIAFRLGEDLSGAHIDGEAARKSVTEVSLALEVIDSRFGTWNLALVDSVADNASSARFVMGEMVPLDSGLDICAEQLDLTMDGEVVASGCGRDVLGDPFNALAWLARRLSSLGADPQARLRAGDVVLAGAVHASLPLTAGVRLMATSRSLPPVRLQTT